MLDATDINQVRDPGFVIVEAHSSSRDRHLRRSINLVDVKSRSLVCWCFEDRSRGEFCPLVIMRWTSVCIHMRDTAVRERIVTTSEQRNGKSTDIPKGRGYPTSSEIAWQVVVTMREKGLCEVLKMLQEAISA